MTLWSRLASTVRHGAWVDELARDVRYAVRTFLKQPGFTFVVVLTLALGTGANTAVFSVVNSIVFRPLPVAHSDRLYVVATSRAGSLAPVSFPDLEDYRAGTRGVFEDIAGYSVGFLGLAAEREPPARVLVSWVTGNYFSLLGVQPAAGRLIQPTEGRPGRVDPVAVLGYATWRRRFHGDASVIGRTVRLNGQPCTVIGVVPEYFLGTFAFSESEVYIPVNWTPNVALDDRSARGLHTVARLSAGVTADTAQAALDAVAAGLARDHRDTDGNVKLKVLPERLARPEENNARSNAFGAGMMLMLVGLVLVAAEVNIANLLFSRTAARRRELAIRGALGASPGRLVRQLVTESSTLAVLGGAAGVVVGIGMTRLLTMMRLPGDLPVRFDFHFDERVLTYALAVTAVTAVFVGPVTAYRASHANVDEALRGDGQRSIVSGSSHRLRRALIVAQIAVCFVLLVAGGLFMRSLARAEHADFGFRPDGVLNVHMNVAEAGYPDARGRAFFEAVERRVRQLPGVLDVAFAFTVPMGYVRAIATLEAEGVPATGVDRVTAGKNIVDARYFETLGIRIEGGRGFTDADDTLSRPVAIVNRRLADTLWPGQDPIGRRFSESGSRGPWLQVVGTTSTGKYFSLFEDPQPYFYVPSAQAYSALRVLHVRTSLPPQSLAADVSREIRALEPALPLYDVQSMNRALDGGYGLFLVRTGAWFAAILAGVGMLLALIGLYGIVSYTTSQRTQEIGVRIALGASAGNVVALVIGDGAKLTAAGMALGLVAAAMLARTLSGLLFGLQVFDAASFAGAAALVVVIAFLATYVPARRAARVNPIDALRAE